MSTTIIISKFPLLLLCAISILLPIISSLNYWTKTKTRFLAKKVVDCVFPIWSYIGFLLTHYLTITDSTDGEMGIYTSVLLGIVLILTYFIFFVQEFVMLSKVDERVAKTPPFAVIIANLFIVLLVLFSIMNYVLYLLCPNQYQLPEGLSFWTIGFEFVYYTFSLIITYSGTSIEAIGVVTKFFQMIEVATCYICIGVCLTYLIDKLKS